MLRREALVALAQGQRLRRLHEAPRPLGIAFEIHRQLSLPFALHIGGEPVKRAAPAPPRDGSKPGPAKIDSLRGARSPPANPAQSRRKGRNYLRLA